MGGFQKALAQASCGRDQDTFGYVDARFGFRADFATSVEAQLPNRQGALSGEMAVNRAVQQVFGIGERNGTNL
jgi:hypothetical protein